jgi:hypothetical protein
MALGAAALVIIVLWMGAYWLSTDHERGFSFFPGLSAGESGGVDQGANTSMAASATTGAPLTDAATSAATSTAQAASGADRPASSGASGERGSEGAAAAPTNEQPAAPRDPVRWLNANFDEEMFPRSLGGADRVSAASVEGDTSIDVEVSATYKRTGSGAHDLLRLTVRRTASKAAASKAIQEVMALYPDRPVSYKWGGRAITQGMAAMGVGEEPGIGVAWVRGAYVIDASVYPPYADGADGARAALLGVVADLPY